MPSTTAGDRIRERRIPYEVAGNDADETVENYMLLDASAQRAKSWSCENCSNFTQGKNPAICVARSGICKFFLHCAKIWISNCEKIKSGELSRCTVDRDIANPSYKSK